MKKELALLSKFAKNKTITIIQDTVLIRDGYMVAYDLERYIRIPTSIVGAGVFSLSEIKKVLSKYPDADISISDTKMTVSQGTKKFSFESLDIDEYPILPEIGDKVGTIKVTKQFYNMRHFASKDELRYTMTGIHLSKKQICSTDAHKLRVLNDHLDITAKITVPIGIMDTPEGDYDVMMSDDYVTLTNNHYTVGLRKVDGIYPDFSAVIPDYDKMPIRVQLHRKEFESLIDDCMMVANSTTMRAFIKGNIIRAEDIDMSREFSAEYNPVSIEGDVEFSFNLAFMKLCLLDQPDVVELRFTAPNRACMIGPNSLLMPVLKG
jgi:DNA polymerase III sliding clamp (beta) subunit (PCNA family)